jgi:hypothetical protein
MCAVNVQGKVFASYAEIFGLYPNYNDKLKDGRRSLKFAVSNSVTDERAVITCFERCLVQAGLQGKVKLIKNRKRRNIRVHV